jgi:hypothetical protein
LRCKLMSVVEPSDAVLNWLTITFHSGGSQSVLPYFHLILPPLFKMVDHGYVHRQWIHSGLQFTWEDLSANLMHLWAPQERGGRDARETESGVHIANHIPDGVPARHTLCDRACRGHMQVAREGHGPELRASMWEADNRTVGLT